MVFGQIPVSGTSSATASAVQVPLVPGRVFVPSISLYCMSVCLSMSITVIPAHAAASSGVLVTEKPLEEWVRDCLSFVL